MRLLTETEMDQVFGGQDSSNVTTLPEIVVTASRQQSSGGYWLGGWSAFAQDEYYGGGGGGGSACYYTSQYQPLPSPVVPTPEGMRCAITAAAVPGYGFPAGMNLHMVNSYAYQETTPGASNYGDIVLTSSQTAPYGYDAPLYASYGQTSSASHVYLYAGGMVSAAGSNPYVDVNTGSLMPALGALTARENQILTLAHEAAHLVLGPSASEEVVEGYGVEAVKNFRNGVGANCPN